MLLIFMIGRAALLSVYFMHNYSLNDVLISADSAGGGIVFRNGFAGTAKVKMYFRTKGRPFVRTRSCACAHTYILAGLIALYNNPPSRQSAAPPPFKKGGKRVEMSPPPWEMGIYTNPPYTLSPLCKGHPTSCPPFDKGVTPQPCPPCKRGYPTSCPPYVRGN